MKDTLNIFGKSYKLTDSQKESVQPIWDAMFEAIEAAGEPEGEMYDGKHIGNVPDPYMPIAKPFLEKIEEILA